MRETTLEYARKLYQLWLRGHVHQVWFWEYPELFKLPDFANVRNQYRRGHHFGEWYTAIYFHKRGWNVLIEKYVFRKHRADHRIAQQLLGKQAMSFLEKNARRVAQPPDLLVFDPHHKFYFFAEVKRERDRLRNTQSQFFQQIQRKFGCQVLVVNLKERR